MERGVFTYPKAIYTYIPISSPYYGALFLGYVALDYKCAEEGAGCGWKLLTFIKVDKLINSEHLLKTLNVNQKAHINPERSNKTPSIS